MLHKNRWLTAFCLVGSVSIIAACSGKSSVPDLSAPSGSHSALGRLRLVNGYVQGINDAPRRGNSAKFEARRAAAHARGRWLSDELNLPTHLVPFPNSESLLKSINSSSTSRSTSAVRQACDTCDPGGGDGTITTVSSFDDQGGYGPYDTEIDFADGTSLLTKEWVDANDGSQVLTFIDQRGMYSMMVGGIFGTNNGTPAPGPTSTPSSQYCYPMDGGYIQCGGQPKNPVPKWACPYIGGGAALAAKWAVAARAGGKAGDVAGLAVGASLISWCNSTGW
jgi:hypothetical protein